MLKRLKVRHISMAQNTKITKVYGKPETKQLQLCFNKFFF